MTKVILFGGAGFIGTNLAIKLSQDSNNDITLVDTDIKFFEELKKLKLNKILYVESKFNEDTDFDELLEGQEIVYHLVSTTVPTTSNQQIPQEISANIIVTSKLLEACVRCNVKKVIFISSGGTVYGKEVCCPLKEETPTYPISSYGLQKITIEKLLYLYNCMYNIDYRVVRLANPYGPYQRPNGILGAVSTFTYKALNDEEITVYGDGSVIRDFIYIDDVVEAIIKIATQDVELKTFNLGCGYGTSIKQLLDIISSTLGLELNVSYREGRKVDVPVNYLDISRYEKYYGKLNPISLEEGIKRTAEFMKKIIIVRFIKMANILFLHAGAEMYGADKVMLDLIKRLDKTKYTPFVILPTSGVLVEALRESGVSVTVMPYPIMRRKYFNIKGIFQYSFTLVKYTKKIIKFAKDNNIKLILLQH